MTVVTYPGAGVELQTAPPLSESTNMQSITIIYTVYIPLHVVGSANQKGKRNYYYFYYYYNLLLLHVSIVSHTRCLRGGGNVG